MFIKTVGFTFLILAGLIVRATEIDKLSLKIPADTEYGEVTAEDRQNVDDWIADWELFPLLCDRYAVRIKGERHLSRKGNDTRVKESHVVFTTIIAEDEANDRMRVIHAAEDPISTEYNIAERMVDFATPIDIGEKFDFLKLSQYSYCKEGFEEVNKFDSKHAPSTLNRLRSTGVFLPTEIGFSNNLGRVDYPHRLFSHWIKETEFKGIVQRDALSICRWDHRYDEMDRVSTYVFFLNGKPVYFEDFQIVMHKDVPTNFKSQGATTVSWKKYSDEWTVPVDVRCLFTWDRNYELRAYLEWQIGKDVVEKWFDISSVGSNALSEPYQFLGEGK